ncbi:MAG: Sapep family Mn(2+)-dependent dipeptidase [Firmicutes bacterium]|nr:Sapep family Mn(2+)-dependent dipeptidase [Bacillota bacterium]
MQKIVDDLAEFIQIESVENAPLPNAPFGADCRAALDLFLDKANAYGLTAADIDGYCGFAEYGQAEEMNAVLCHLDVVPAPQKAWSVPPFALTQKDGFLWGRGVVDNKGPLTVLLHVLKKLRDEGTVLKRRIRLIAGCNEETGGACMAHYVKTQKLPVYGFTPDAEFPVIYSEKGILQVRLKIAADETFVKEVADLHFGESANVIPDYARAMLANGEILRFFGTAGHAMSPENTDNAAWKLFKRLSPFAPCKKIYGALCRKDAAKVLGIACADEKSGALSVALTKGEFSDGALYLTLDLRLPLCTDKTWILDALRKKLNADVEVLYYAPNLYIDPASKLITALSGVYNTAVKKELPPVQTGGGTYARHLPNTAAFGPLHPDTAANIHNADERMRTVDFEKLFDIYYAAVLALDKL